MRQILFTHYYIPPLIFPSSLRLSPPTPFFLYCLHTHNTYHAFGQTILVIFYHSKWFENDLENDLKNCLENDLTLQILRWYKWLRFKDIVWGFGKLKKIIEKSEMEWNGLEDWKKWKNRME